MSSYEVRVANLNKLRNSENESDRIRAALRDIGFLRETRGEIILTFLIKISLIGKAKSWGMTSREIDQEVELGKHLGKLAIKEGIVEKKSENIVINAFKKVFWR